MTNISIVKSDPPETKQILAEAIVKIGEGFAALQAGGVNKRAILVLIRDSLRNRKPPISLVDIEVVLDALPRLKGWYCR